jgi:hypothetical protein
MPADHLAPGNEGIVMSKADFPNSEFLLNRAEQCRSVARTLLDPIVRDQMIDLALGYEKIARTAAKLKSKRPRPKRLKIRTCRGNPSRIFQ